VRTLSPRSSCRGSARSCPGRGVAAIAYHRRDCWDGNRCSPCAWPSDSRRLAGMAGGHALVAGLRPTAPVLRASRGMCEIGRITRSRLAGRVFQQATVCAPDTIRTCAHGSGGRRPNLANFAVYLLVLSCWRGTQATSFRTYSGSCVVVQPAMSDREFPRLAVPSSTQHFGHALPVVLPGRV
jgi:hypothetical protein